MAVQKIWYDFQSALWGNSDFGFDERSLTKLYYPLDLEFTLQNEEYYYSPKDAQGIPIIKYVSVGEQYNPTRIATYALAHFQRYLNANDEQSKKKFFHIAEWFMNSSDGIWPYNFSWGKLSAPWISCMSQG